MTSQDQEMVERVARAICEAEGYAPDYDGDYGPNWNGYTSHARAAIEATDTELVRICGKLLECLHQPPQKAGTNYWHVTRGRHIDFGIIAGGE